jgi:hypothetical protein
MSITVTIDPPVESVATSFEIMAEGVAEGTATINRDILDSLYDKSREIFASTIERPGQSATMGGNTYRPGSRATGKFTFGDNATFRGTTTQSGPISTITYPNEDTADSITDRAWRHLEEGSASQQMPLGIWRDSSGSRVPWGEGTDDQFFPGGRKGRGGERWEVAGIQAKYFIRDAVTDAADRLELAYQELADDIAVEVETYAYQHAPEVIPQPTADFRVFVSASSRARAHWRRPPNWAKNKV